MKLYKYLSYDAAMAFLKDGTLRVSQNNSLNDPFEVLLTERDRFKIRELTKKSIKVNDVEYQTYDDISDFINMSGIISLSKNKESMPMWGNYAEDNKGILVEFEVDEDDPFSMFDFYQMNSPDAYVCGNVKYSNDRNFNKSMYKFSSEEIFEVSKHYFFTKHVSWENEKEFRFVLPFHNSNKIIALDNNFKAQNKLNSLQYKKTLKPGINDISYLFELTTLTPNNIYIWNEIWRNFNSYNILFLMKIKPGNISRIYLGVNSNIEHAKKTIIEGAKAEAGIRGRFYDAHEKKFFDVFKCKLDKDNFKLVYEKII